MKWIFEGFCLLARHFFCSNVLHCEKKETQPGVKSSEKPAAANVNRPKPYSEIKNQDVGGDVAGDIWRIDCEVYINLKLYITLRKLWAIKSKKNRMVKRKKFLCENCHKRHVSSESGIVESPEGDWFEEIGI